MSWLIPTDGDNPAQRRLDTPEEVRTKELCKNRWLSRFVQTLCPNNTLKGNEFMAFVQHIK
ncbi:hypothetical protein ACP179_05895 [Xenorhabdus stockiae]|uniref:hypothetical protein n=1 Tax=Xenorhabdus stockiae TaxID=351614 RepID=UPI003CECD6F9